MDEVTRKGLVKAQIEQYHEWRARWWFKNRVVNRPNLSWFKGPLIVISNHIGLFDHFRIFISLELDEYVQTLPLRFIAQTEFGRFSPLSYSPARTVLEKIYERNKIIPLGEWVNRSYSETLQALRNNERVIVYPEGYTRGKRKRETKDKRPVGAFKHGVVRVHRASGAPILPVAIRRFGIPGNYVYTVNWGAGLLNIPEHLTNGNAAEWLRSPVAQLYEEAVI